MLAVLHSKREAAYYADLKLREKAGEVHGVEIQRPFAITISGLLICTYRCDFSYIDNADKRLHVVDVKGVETDVFRLKKKLMKAVHKIDIEVVK